MPQWLALVPNGDWVAAAQTSLRLIYKMGRPNMSHYLQQFFISASPHTGTSWSAARAAVEGAVFGLAQGLPASAAGQSFAWPYLLGRSPLLPDADPGAWAIGLLAAAAALLALLWPSWVAVWRQVRHRSAAPDRETPGWQPLLAAVIPCWILQARLGPWALRFEAAAAVGLLLALTGQGLYLSERWARAGAERPGIPGARPMPLWVALIGGVAAGFAALPGLSALAILLAAGLYGRASAEGAGRFALMTTTAVLTLEGLTHLPAAINHLHAAFLPLAAGAALGAAAGAWLLLTLLRSQWHRALPVMASYCTALGGLLLMFGVLQR